MISFEKRPRDLNLKLPKQQIQERGTFVLAMLSSKVDNQKTRSCHFPGVSYRKPMPCGMHFLEALPYYHNRCVEHGRWSKAWRFGGLLFQGRSSSSLSFCFRFHFHVSDGLVGTCAATTLYAIPCKSQDNIGHSFGKDASPNIVQNWPIQYVCLALLTPLIFYQTDNPKSEWQSSDAILGRCERVLNFMGREVKGR